MMHTLLTTTVTSMFGTALPGTALDKLLDHKASLDRRALPAQPEQIPL